ncbi:MAG: iron(III) transport system ATP-binding protein, partial [Actinomycetota bacterium]|nr:iron(III) transport system ATP-binding protein [Actinomycetota bacterium]
GVVRGREGERHTVETTDGQLVLDSAAALPAGTEVIVSIRPEAVEVSRDAHPNGVANEWSGKVLTRAFLGDAVDHVVGVGKNELRTRSNPETSIEPGTTVFLRLDPAKLSLVPVG